MGGKTGAESGEPQSITFRRVFKGVLERCKDAGAADVAVLAKDFAGFIKFVGRNRLLNGLDHIAATRVRDEAVGFDGTHSEEGTDGFSGEGRDIAVELIFEAPAGIHEADFFPMLGFMEGVEVLKTELPSLVFPFPDGGGCPIAKEAEADQHAGLVIQIKSGRGNFHSNCGNGRFFACGKEPSGAFQEREGGAAAKAQYVLQKNVRAQAKDLGDVAAQAGTQITLNPAVGNSSRG